LNLSELKLRMAEFGSVHGNEFLLKCSLDRYELTIFADGRAVIRGTQDPAVARSLYAKYVGS
jgi:adenylyltransferase/sulfurtransferase